MRIFRISFVSQGKVYVLYAERVQQAELFGFVELSGILFGEHASMVIDPAEEKLKGEFDGVARTLVPMHAVIRIDEVEKRGQNKILELESGSNVMPFPVYTPGRGGDR
jgi:hypothetical protein